MLPPRGSAGVAGAEVALAVVLVVGVVVAVLGEVLLVVLRAPEAVAPEAVVAPEVLARDVVVPEVVVRGVVVEDPSAAELVGVVTLGPECPREAAT